MHVRIDGRIDTLHRGRLTTSDLDAFCREAVSLTGLKLIAGPFTVEFGETVQAIAILAESHVSVEALRDAEVYFVDVFTCAPFDERTIADLCVTKLGDPWTVDCSARGDNLSEIKP